MKLRRERLIQETQAKVAKQVRLISSPVFAVSQAAASSANSWIAFTALAFGSLRPSPCYLSVPGKIVCCCGLLSPVPRSFSIVSPTQSHRIGPSISKPRP